MFLRSLLLVGLLGLAVVARADGAAAELAARLAPLAQLSGRFEQTVEGGGGATPARSAGRFSLRRPDQFRWEIIEPDRQLLVAGNGVLWHYDRDLATATRRRFDDAASAPLLLLAADGPALAGAFAVEVLAADRYRIVPRAENAGFREAELTFAATLPATMRITDRLGQAIDIRFLALDQAPLPAGTFDFTPPAGVDVYREDN
ncbi:outer membrane lipoprotein chaperone LolA [Pseudohaliea rubra]|uniref:Outer-membrane lipoprotein carrier protein n=1 Tax=Pseudohaliea rubra DSM 19751 TaxID=1265313 RepID=A0A095XUZ9_9GAMM|nr:outer membrane lipoprotein chaperone LolA [Pseudohaliea rubra]KGE03516.1 Outer membrane lipoprotein carrier protein LolA [Pseudohaliea rubra DSM 19751]